MIEPGTLPLEICHGHKPGTAPLRCINCARQLGRAEGAAQERARIVAAIRKRWDGHEALLILDMLEATRTPPPPEAQK